MLSPTIGAAITVRYWFLRARYPACRTTGDVDLRRLDWHRSAAVTALTPSLSCRSCRPNVLGASAVKTHRRGLECAMNAINWDLRNLTVQVHSGLRWADIKRQLTGWRHLEGLDDRGLEDIGISCGSPATLHLISR